MDKSLGGRCGFEGEMEGGLLFVNSQVPKINLLSPIKGAVSCSSSTFCFFLLVLFCSTVDRFSGVFRLLLSFEVSVFVREFARFALVVYFWNIVGSVVHCAVTV